MEKVLLLLFCVTLYVFIIQPIIWMFASAE